MPTYDYKCPQEECGHVFEVFHRMSETPSPECPTCKSVGCTRQFSSGIACHNGKQEIWAYNDIHKVNPKWLKSRDGKTRVRYDPTKHGGRKGSG